MSGHLSRFVILLYLVLLFAARPAGAEEGGWPREGNKAALLSLIDQAGQ